MSNGLWFRLWCQDFRGRRIGMGDTPPAKEFRDFLTKEAAEAAKQLLPKDPDAITTITPIPLGAGRKAAITRRATSPLL